MHALSRTSRSRVYFCRRPRRLIEYARKIVRRFSYTKPLSDKTTQVIKLGPGLIHIKNALKIREQKILKKAVFSKCKDPKSRFYPVEPWRDRMFRALDLFPEEISLLLAKNLSHFTQCDPNFPTVAATHALSVLYKTNITPPKGVPPMPWHIDNGDNDGEGQLPIVSVSIGDRAKLLYAYERPRTSKNHPLSSPENAHSADYNSGDLIAYYGPKGRRIWHAVYEMFPETGPRELDLPNQRLNVTFRYVPKIIGLEEQFYRVEPGLRKNNRFFRLHERARDEP